MNFDIQVLIEQRQAILEGLLTTLGITAMSTVLALGLGMLLALGRFTTRPVVRWPIEGYIQFFRNTPLLVQLYIFYKALPAFGIVIAPLGCGILALSLQTSAYMAEIYRAGLESIPREQYESGRSLGFSRWQTFRTVILPQALGIILPPAGNQIVGLAKNSSLVAFITVPDLFYVIFTGGAQTFRYLEFFTLGILLYMALTLLITLLFSVLEKALPLSWRNREVIHG